MRPLIFPSLASLALLAAPISAHAISTAVNALGENSTSASLSLQGIINSRGNTLVDVGGGAHQLSHGIGGGDAWWNASGNLTSSLVVEVAGYASQNAFGIYSISDPSQKLQIFGGSATGGATALTVPGFDTFGFYLENTNAGFTWYSDAALNDDGLDHMVAYQGHGESLAFGNGSLDWNEDTFLLGWEDLSGLGDWDYNDMVVTVSNLSSWTPTLSIQSSEAPAVPDGGSTFALAGFVLAIGACFRRRARR